METLLENRYRVIQTLGGGGFGETFLAEDTQMPSNRRCVVKLLKPIHNNPQIYQLVQERFQREAAILEELGSYSDQIPTLYAYFQSNEQFYLIQEWIEGDTLTAKFYKQGVFSESLVRDIFVNLLPVLEYVHSKRIIHRDIKPDNIILRHRDSKPVLIDFGAVRESMGTVVNSQGNPTSSIVIGTPGYMPSEQAAGRPMYSSDIYSLGMTAIYLLTGKQPHELETDPRSGEIMWHQHALSVSPTLAAVIDRAIAYHPRERFATAREMLEALQLGAVSYPPTVPYHQPQPQPPTVPYQPPQPQPAAVPPAITLPNTVAVSPATPTPPQPVNPSSSNGNQRVLIGSLVAGGLISTLLLIGFALTRPNQPAPQSVTSTSQSTTSSNSTPSPESTDTSTNSQTNTTETTAPSTDSPETGNSSEVNNSTTSETPNSSESTTSEENSESSASDRSSPEKAVQHYYNTLNQGHYETAWNQLSPGLQNNRQLHPNGYRSYLDWWEGQVESVTVDNISLVENNTETATVNTNLTYYLKNGKESSSSVQFSLTWDAGNNSWLVNEAK